MNISDEAAEAVVIVRRTECSCCGPWVVERGDLIAEFSTRSEAEDFAWQAQIRRRVERLASIHGITDAARIEKGIADIVVATQELEEAK